MEALREFFGPLVAAYLSACVTWLLVTRLRPKLWPPAPAVSTDRPWLDLGLATAAAIAMAGLNQADRNGYLLHAGTTAIGPLAFTLNQLIIFMPIAIVLIVRGQGPATVFLQPTGLPVKLLSGVVLGLLGVAVYLGMAKRLGEMPQILLSAVMPHSLENAIAIFLKAVAIAFLFVRVRWSFGLAAALIIPGLLQAIRFLPAQLNSHAPMDQIAIHLALCTLLSAGILYLVQLSGDVVWIAIVYYMIEVADGGL